MWVDLITLEKSLQNIEEYIHNHSVEDKHWDSFKEYTRKVKKIWQKDFNDFFKKYEFRDNQITRIENV
jgi:predicted Zn-dependent peptidase